MKTLHKLGVAGIAALLVLVFIFQCIYDFGQIDKLNPPKTPELGLVIQLASIYTTIKLIILLGGLYFVGLYVYELITSLNNTNKSSTYLRKNNGQSNMTTDKDIKQAERIIYSVDNLKTEPTNSAKQLILDKELEQVFDMPLASLTKDVPLTEAKAFYSKGSPPRRANMAITQFLLQVAKYANLISNDIERKVYRQYMKDLEEILIVAFDNKKALVAKNTIQDTLYSRLYATGLISDKEKQETKAYIEYYYEYFIL